MKWFWRIFLKGLATVLPIFITLYALYWLAVTSEHFLGNVIKRFFSEDYYWPGMGSIAAIAFIMLVGILINNRVGQFLVRKLHYLITHVPVAKTIYNSVQDLLQFFASSREKEKMDQVVEVNVGQDMRLIGFITQPTPSIPIHNESNEELVGVYLPLSYQIGGYTIYVPRDKIRRVDMSVEQAMRLTLTAGMTGDHADPPI